MEKEEPRAAGKAYSKSSKPGGGGKMQAFLPKWNGEKSGQYATMRKVLRYTRPDRRKAKSERRSADWPNCGGERVPNVKGAYNFAKPKTKAVAEAEKSGYHESLPSKHKPNSVIKK